MTHVLCPWCLDRGWYRVAGRAELQPCNHPECTAGRNYRETRARIAAEPAPTALPPVPLAPKPDPKVIRRVLCTTLRRAGETRIARALEVGDLKGLSDRERALLDAAMSGQGYLVNGRRVAPEDVVIVPWVEQSA